MRSLRSVFDANNTFHFVQSNNVVDDGSRHPMALAHIKPSDVVLRALVDVNFVVGTKHREHLERAAWFENQEGVNGRVTDVCEVGYR